MWPYILAGLQVYSNYSSAQQQRKRDDAAMKEELRLGYLRADYRRRELSKMIDNITLTSFAYNVNPNTGSALYMQKALIAGKQREDIEDLARVEHSIDKRDMNTKYMNLMKNSLFTAAGVAAYSGIFDAQEAPTTGTVNRSRNSFIT